MNVCHVCFFHLPVVNPNSKVIVMLYYIVYVFLLGSIKDVVMV